MIVAPSAGRSTLRASAAESIGSCVKKLIVLNPERSEGSSARLAPHVSFALLEPKILRRSAPQDSCSSPRHRRNERQLVAVAQHLIGIGVAFVNGGHGRLHVVAQLAVLLAKAAPDIGGARAFRKIEYVVALAGDVAQHGEIEKTYFHHTPI